MGLENKIGLPKRLLMDLHQTLLPLSLISRFFPKSIHYPKTPFTEQEWLTTKGYMDAGDIDSLESLVFVANFGDNRPLTPPHRRDNLPLWVPNNERTVGLYHFATNFGIYRSSRGIRKALKEIREMDIKITVITGVSDCCLDNVEWVLDKAGIKENLDPELPLILTASEAPIGKWPYLKVSTTANTPIGMAICTLRDGQPPISVDDAIEKNDIASRLFGVPSYNPLPREVAERRRLIFFPDELEKHAVDKSYVFLGHSSISNLPKRLRQDLV